MKSYGLFIDVGNTSIKVGIGDKHTLVTSYTIPTKSILSGDLLGFQLVQIIKHAEEVLHTKIRVSVCVVSSVVPEIDVLVRYACNRFFMCQVFIVHKDIFVPLDNHYEYPFEVGSDRLVAAYAARKLFSESPSIIVIDYGTATTFDCVTDNIYLGGLICPGVNSSLKSLSENAAKLPYIALESVKDTLVIGKNTDMSLTQGFLLGFAAMTEGLYTKLMTILTGPVVCIATGGFALDISSVLSCFDAICPDLVLDGLRLLWVEQSDSN